MTRSKTISTLLLFSVLLAFSHFLSAHEVASDNKHNSAHSDIRIVMSAAFVSQAGIGVYQEIADYLAKKLHHGVSFVSGFSYSTINSMFDSGIADLGFVCGLPYILKHDVRQPNIELLLAPVMKDKKYKDKPVYFSYVIVRKDSKLNSIADLKGSTFVYNDEISNSGYNMPRAHLIDIGETAGFFAKVIRSGSHEESIRKVALGEADASAVDSLVYDYDVLNNPQYTKQTKVIKALGPAGIPPIVISTKIDPALRQSIREILLGMNKDPEGKVILDHALVDRFDTVDDSNYDGIRKMYQQALDSGFQEIR